MNQEPLTRACHGRNDGHNTNHLRSLYDAKQQPVQDKSTKTEHFFYKDPLGVEAPLKLLAARHPVCRTPTERAFPRSNSGTHTGSGD